MPNRIQEAELLFREGATMDTMDFARPSSSPR